MVKVPRHIKTVFAKSIYIGFSILLLCATYTYSQDYYNDLAIDDLRQEYAITYQPNSRAYILYQSGLYYQVKEYKVDSVLNYGNRLLQLGKESDSFIATVLGHRLLGSQYSRNSEFTKSKDHLYKSLAIAEANDYKLHIYDSYNPLAKTYYNLNVLDSTIYYFKKSISSCPKNENSKLSYFHAGLSKAYFQLGRYEKQEEHVLQAYEEAIAGELRLDQIIALTYILKYYSTVKKDPTKFNVYIKEYDSLMEHYSNFTSSYHPSFELKDDLSYEDKVIFLEEALVDNKKTKYLQGVFYNYIQLQRTHTKNEEFTKSVKISNNAIEFYNSNKSVRLDYLVEIYKNKWLAESKLTDLKTALNTVKQYHHLKDSLEEGRNTEHINELNIKYETAQKDAELSAATLNINRSKAQRNYALLGSALLLMLGFFFWKRSKDKQEKIETENKLQAEKIINLEKEKTILSLASMIEGQEAERTRIAQDLHDGLGGLLSSVRNHFSLIQDEVKKLDQLNVYDRTNSMIDQACKEVRRISHNLMPASLQLNGLISTVSQYCSDVEASTKLEVHFEHTGMEDIRLGDTKEIFIYRIVQEAVANVLKHANASTLLVQLGLYEREISLIIEDNGSGFDANTKSDGIGLKSIKSRVEHIKGLIDIDSKIGTGTTITINIPHDIK